MNILSWIIGLPVAVAVVLFALSNRQDVTLGFWPWDGAILLPAYLLALVPLLAGFLLGTASAAVRGLRYRRAARVEAKRAAALQRELDALKAQPTIRVEPPAIRTAPGLPEAP